MALASTLYTGISAFCFAAVFTQYLSGLHLLFSYLQFIAFDEMLSSYFISSLKEGNKSAHTELCVTMSRLL